MPCRSRENQGIFFPKTHTSHSEPSFFFSDCELEYLLGDPPKIFEEPVGEEEEPTSPVQDMAENINHDVFPIKETNGDTNMKNINPSTLPHFDGLASKKHDTFIFEFSLVCRNYDYASDEKKFQLFPSILKNATLR